MLLKMHQWPGYIQLNIHIIVGKKRKKKGKKKRKNKHDQHDYCIAMKTGMNMYLVFQYDYVVIIKLFSFLVESKDRKSHALDM